MKIRMIALKNFLFIVQLPCLLLTACSAVKPTISSSESNRQQDSIRVEVRERIIQVPDTVYVEVPRQTAERTTLGDTSYLENDYAESEARINADGSLYHSLNSKPQKIAVPTTKTVEQRDSVKVEYKDIDSSKSETKTVYVDKQLTWLQKTQIYGFWAAIIFLLICYRKKIYQAVVRRILKK